MKFRIYFFIAFVAFSSILEGQIAHQLNTWSNLSTKITVSEKNAFSAMYSLRRHNIFENWQQSLLRLTAFHKINSKIVLGAGYDHVINFPYGEYPIAKRNIEHRSFQTIRFNQKHSNNISVFHLYRLEQRYFADNTKHRMRYRLGLSYKLPLGETKHIVLSCYDEIFMNIQPKFKGQILHQNWANFSIKYPTNYGDFTLGYMNQFLIKGEEKAESNHIMTFGIHKSFSL